MCVVVPAPGRQLTPQIDSGCYDLRRITAPVETDMIGVVVNRNEGRLGDVLGRHNHSIHLGPELPSVDNLKHDIPGIDRYLL